MEDEALLRYAAGIVPSARQLDWHRLEFYGFLHFGLNTFTGQEWGDGSVSPERFAPDVLDADQWVAAARSAGMRALILTAKHHDGFCLWPTRTTDYSVRASRWQNGQGDVVRLAAEACRSAGLAFGVYLSPWDRHERCYGSGRPYDDFYCAQLAELLTEYGPLCCVWLDGACGEGAGGRVQRYDWQRYYRLIRRLQPGAAICVSGPDVRWCGNEAGHCRTSEWSVVPAALLDPNYVAAHSQQADDRSFARRTDPRQEDLGSLEALRGAGPLAWYPAEVDLSIRPGWFYHPEEDSQVRPAEELFSIYLRSVGANASLLLNLPPDRHGRIPPPDCAVLAELGERISRCFGTPLPAAVTADSSAPTDGSYWRAARGCSTAELTVRLPAPALVHGVELREHLPCGQHIEAGEIWANGEKICSFTVVGSRRLCLFRALRAQQLTVRITASRTEPTLQTLAVYGRI